MTGLGSRFLLFVFLCLTLAAPAHAEKRVALIIGNGFYQYQPILPNPKHDAEDVAKALGDLNFDVVLGLDLTRAGMNEKLDEFSRKADGADIAFVYYSGHGMQYGGFNYLLPTDASLDSAADVNPFRLVRIDNVMETLSTVNGPKIVVLDACRDNPVANELKRKLAALRGARGAEVTRGLSPISGTGLLVAYATQANETALDGKGRNSPFTAAFIKKVADPDTDIRQMFFRVQDEVVRETDGKQRPEISVSLVGEYKLKITITPVTPAAPVAGGPGEAERAWGFVKDTTSQKVLEEFIYRFGDTLYGTLAREKLEELKKATALAEAARRAEQAKAEQAKAEQAKAEQAKAEQAEKDRQASEQAERERLAREEAELREKQQKAMTGATPSPNAATVAPNNPPGPTAMLTPPAPPPIPNSAEVLSGGALIEAIKKQLKRVGCYSGRIDDNWTSAETKLSVGKFVKFAKLTSVPSAPDIDFLNALRAKSVPVCPLEEETPQLRNGEKQPAHRGQATRGNSPHSECLQPALCGGK